MNVTTRILFAAAVTSLAASPALAGRHSHGTPPGQQMHESGSVAGKPGASGYAPGHEKAGKMGGRHGKHGGGGED